MSEATIRPPNTASIADEEDDASYYLSGFTAPVTVITGYMLALYATMTLHSAKVVDVYVLPHFLRFAESFGVGKWLI